jgi:hypothetical protein
MEKLIHPNAVKSANLLRLSILIYLISYWFSRNSNSIFDAEAMLLTIVILLVSAYLVRRGYSWVRWMLLVLLIPGIVLAIIAIPFLFKPGLIYGYVAVIQGIIQAIAVIILFIPYKPIPIFTEDII